MKKTMAVKYWTIGLLFLSVISIDFFISETFALSETAGKRSLGKSATDAADSGISKVKCKEEIEEALRKQQKGKGDKAISATPSLEDDDDDNDDDDNDDDDDDDSEEENQTQEVKKGTNRPTTSTGQVKNDVKDTKSAAATVEDDDDDDDDDDDEDDDDDNDNDTKEDKTGEDDDDDDDDDDEDDDEDATKDDDNTDEDNDEEQSASLPAKGKTATPTPTTSSKIPEPTKAPTTTPSKSPTTTPSPAKKEVEKKIVKQEPVKKPEPTKKPEVKKPPEPPTKKIEKPSPLTSKKSTEPSSVAGKRSTKLIESDEDDDNESGEEYKSRSQVEDILKLYEIGTKSYLEEETLTTATFKDLKKIYELTIKPLEQMYKYKFISSRLITDAEIFSKPMVLFCGPKSSGKTSLVNYLLGVESTPWQLQTGVTLTSPSHFTIVEYGESFSKLSPMEISADFAFSNLQQFGQHFVENHLEAYRMPLSILQRITIVDSPGLVDGLLNKAPEPGKSIDAEVYQWFVDRADIIYIVVESTQIHLTQAMKDLLEQLKGRDVRFIISKAEMISQTQAVMLIGQLLWSLSPVMPSDTPPQVYALTTYPVSEYNPFLDVQEEQWLTDLSKLISAVSRVESRSSAIRRHAVRVRNHAKVVDCYLSAYYKRKPLFSFGNSAKKLAQDITENPHNYNIFQGALASITQNVSRYDLPDPDVYREFFRINPLLDFKQLSSTCSFFSGCPIDKLDKAIAYRLPDLVAKFKKTITSKDKQGKGKQQDTKKTTSTTASSSTVTKGTKK